MAGKNKLVLVVVVASVVAFVALRRGGHEDVQTVDQNIVLDRIWIDHIPQNDRDMIQLFVAITEQPFGIFQKTSQWSGQYELFQYEANGNQLRIHYGQTGDKERVEAKATRCKEKGMDYCLELSGASRGVKKYYSMEGWVIDGTDSLEHLRQRLATLAK